MNVIAAQHRHSTVRDYYMTAVCVLFKYVLIHWFCRDTEIQWNMWSSPLEKVTETEKKLHYCNLLEMPVIKF